METRIPDQTKGKGSNHEQKNVPASAGRPGSSDEHPPFRHMQMLKERSPGLRVSSDLTQHHLGFQDPSLGASLFRPKEEKHSAKRWPEPLELTSKVGEALVDKDKDVQSNVIEEKSGWSLEQSLEQSSKHPGFQDKSLGDFLLCPPADKSSAERGSDGGLQGLSLEDKLQITEKPIVEPTPTPGWKLTAEALKPRPPFLPNGVIKATLVVSAFIDCLKRLMLFFKNESIQATFCDEPPSVRLQTLDLVELSIKFWAAPDDQFCVDMQKCRGDNFKFHKIMHRLLEVIKGVDKPATEGEDPAAAMGYAKILEMYGVLENVAPKPLMDSTKHTKRIILMVNSQLMSASFSQRASGLESLTQATDILCTMVPHAREVALVVLTGKAPAELSESLDQQCREIQNVLIHVLVAREFVGDDAWRTAVFGKETVPAKKVESDHHPFKKSRTDFQGQYESVMMSSIHKVLTILSNSLVALNSENNDTWNSQDVISSFLSRCREAAEQKSLVSILETLMLDGIKECMAVAYLACHVLRLLSEVYPPLIKELGADSVRKSVDKAYQTGRVSHSLLEKESRLLLDKLM